jgi:hypothetical protein
MNSASEKIEDAFFKKQDQELIENLRRKQKPLTLSDAIKSIKDRVLHNYDDGNTEAALKLIKYRLQK